MGTLVYSPILYNWYKWLDGKFPGIARKTILKKLVLDQFLLTPPLLVIFYTGMSLMELKFDDPFEECRKKFVATFQRSCLFWLPAQTVNFILIPPAFRVIYMGFASFCWVNILCFLKRQKLEEFEPVKVN
jgi:Mpv17-like protein